MKKEEINTLCADAIKQWGFYAQVNIAIEEMAELTVALEHFRRGRATMEDVQTEIADVTICCLQLVQMFGEEGCNNQFAYKLDRLKQRLEESKQNEKEKSVPQGGA